MNRVLPRRCWEHILRDLEEPQMSVHLNKFLNYKQLQVLIEYALLLAFLVLAAIAVFPFLGKAINNIFSTPETVYF
jgi:hypothetical protein